MSSKSFKDTSWGKETAWYDDLLEKNQNTYQKSLILPNLLRILLLGKGVTVLDLGCGQGFFARAFAEAGASVTGADVSAELITRARKHGSPGIRYEVAPSENLAFAPEASVDAVTIILAIQNMEDLMGTFRECARVLRPHGIMVMVMNHPAFRIPRQSAWEWDEENCALYRRVDGYLSESHAEIVMHPGKNGGSKTVSFHRPLQVYMKALAKSGFAITRLEEWISHKKSAQGPRAREENRVRKEIPLFLCLEARKV